MRENEQIACMTDSAIFVVNIHKYTSNKRSKISYFETTQFIFQ